MYVRRLHTFLAFYQLECIWGCECGCDGDRSYIYKPSRFNSLCLFIIIDRKVEVPSSRIVILEGIYALSEKIRPFLDLRVSVTGGVHFDLVKRVLRDINRSGQAPEDIIQQVSETVSFVLSLLLFILF